MVDWTKGGTGRRDGWDRETEGTEGWRVGGMKGRKMREFFFFDVIICLNSSNDVESRRKTSKI